ncbi:MAG TPA: hypothetical protein VNK51_12560 [Bradyrhizobium sp.]|nr:hypothetical protein [Bradyrhizobium sp.]
MTTTRATTISTNTDTPSGKCRMAIVPTPTEKSRPDSDAEAARRAVS